MGSELKFYFYFLILFLIFLLLFCVDEAFVANKGREECREKKENLKEEGRIIQGVMRASQSSDKL